MGFPVRIWLLVGGGLPVLGLVAANVLFATSAGTGMIERRIESRLRVGCKIEQVSWWPWAGIAVSNLRLLAPEGARQETDLVTIDEITIDPSWRSLFQGKKRWERLAIRGVTVDLSLEALKEVMAQDEIRAGQKVPGGKEAGGVATASESGEEVKPERTATEAKREGVADEEAGAPDDPIEAVDDFEGVVVFSEVKVRVYSVRMPDQALVIDGMEGEIPLWGEDRTGVLKLARLALGNLSEEHDLEIPVRWLNRTVTLDSGVIKLFGLEIALKAVLRAAPGFPVGVQVDLPPQDADLSPMFVDRPSPLELTGLSSRSVVQGYLLSPASFTGRSFTKFEGMIFHDLEDGGDTSFVRGRAIFQASAAGIVARDLRAIGDEDAILANGFALSNGEAAATVRIVSSPERAVSHEGRVKRANEDLTLAFEDLVTPDRRYRDLRLELRKGDLMVDLAESRDWVPFFPVLWAVVGRRNLEIDTMR